MVRWGVSLVENKTKHQTKANQTWALWDHVQRSRQERPGICIVWQLCPRHYAHTASEESPALSLLSDFAPPYFIGPFKNHMKKTWTRLGRVQDGEEKTLTESLTLSSHYSFAYVTTFWGVLSKRRRNGVGKGSMSSWPDASSVLFTAWPYVTRPQGCKMEIIRAFEG